ncbi:MAG: hypothetical protein B6D58_06925 [candidate division Zixibacteria bacterium 4484_95]|nr:MAG: hypothetical protein B6D58_06925 [candidate division Zixibacteria bacterium 4484_95]
MIYVYGQKKDYCSDLTTALNSKSFEVQVFDDRQSLGSAFKRAVPQGVFYDLRFESDVPRILEKIYLEDPEIVVLGVAETHLEIFGQYTDQLFLPHKSFEEIANGFVEHLNDRQLLASCNLVGRSIELVGVARMIQQVGPTDITVLITGPSGVGKEMVARALHAKSGKPGEKFIGINISSLAPGVLESELWQDLFYRLNVVNITIPPLSARPKDIPPLVKEFIMKSRYSAYTGAHPVEPGAMKMFLRYHWPGNVRELKNVIESLLILSEKGVVTKRAFENYLQEKSLHDRSLPVPTGRSPQSAEHQLIIQAILSLKEEINALRGYLVENLQLNLTNNAQLPDQQQSLNLGDNEKNIIAKTLQEVGGNRKRAAALLGIGERTLYRKLDKYGLK